MCFCCIFMCLIYYNGIFCLAWMIFSGLVTLHQRWLKKSLSLLIHKAVHVSHHVSRGKENPLTCFLKTKEVQRAMNEKRFEEAIQLRGRWESHYHDRCSWADQYNNQSNDVVYRSFENNWNMYKLLAYQKPAAVPVTHHYTLTLTLQIHTFIHIQIHKEICLSSQILCLLFFWLL